MDTVVRCDENLFLMLVEGPVNREAVSEVATKILADCIGLTQKLDDPKAFNLHIPIWHDTPRKQTHQQVLGSLKTCLRRMASGPKRYVQFVDSTGGLASTPPEDSTRREDLMAKINAIETSHRAVNDKELSRLQGASSGSGKAVL